MVKCMPCPRAPGLKLATQHQGWLPEQTKLPGAALLRGVTEARSQLSAVVSAASRFSAVKCMPCPRFEAGNTTLGVISRTNQSPRRRTCWWRTRGAKSAFGCSVSSRRGHGGQVHSTWSPFEGGTLTLTAHVLNAVNSVTFFTECRQPAFFSLASLTLP